MEFVGTLDDALERLGHERAMGLVTGHLAHQEQRSVTQLHLLARLDGECRDTLRGNLGNKLGDAPSDLDAVLVKLLFPKHAGQHRAAQLQLGQNVAGRRALRGAHAASEIEKIQSGHKMLLAASFSRLACICDSELRGSELSDKSPGNQATTVLVGCSYC